MISRMSTLPGNKLDPRVTAAIEQSEAFLFDLMPQSACGRLWELSKGLDIADRYLVLQRAISLVVGHWGRWGRFGTTPPTAEVNK
jgi:hypothetical protein